MAYFPDYTYLDHYRPLYNKSYSSKYTEEKFTHMR